VGPRGEGVPGLGERQQAPVDAELEQRVVVQARPCASAPLGQYLLADHAAYRRIGHLAGAAGHREAVLLPRRRTSLAVQRVAPVPAQVGLLGPGDGEHVQPGGADHRAHRVHPRAAVGPDGGEKAQADVPLIDLPPPLGRQGRLLALEFRPGHHAADVTRLSLTPHVSDLP